MTKRPLFRLEIFEVRQPLQVVTQMSRRQGALEARPASGLRLIATPERLEHIDPRIFPFEIGPTASPVLGRLDRLQCLLGPARREQSPRDLSGDFRHLPDRLVILSDERVDITLCVGDLLECQSNGADARSLGYIVSINRSSGPPADDLPLIPAGFRTGSADSAIMRCFRCSSPIGPRAGFSAWIRSSNWP